MPWERWDEWLILGSGWLYKQDVKIEELGKQQSAIAKYLDTVDEILFGRRQGDLRGRASEQECLARREKGPGRRLSASPEALGSAGMWCCWREPLSQTLSQHERRDPCRVSLSRMNQLYLRPLQKKNMVMSTAMVHQA
jgi:hypothetical protein